MKRATFFCGGKLVPASRFRVDPIAHRLKEDAWDVDVRYGYGAFDQKIPEGIGRVAYRASMRAMRSLRTALEPRHGPVLIQRLAWPLSSLPERLLAWRGRPIVFDFDDAIFLDESAALQQMRSKAFNQICLASAHVIAGNSWLASHVPSGVPVTVIPTGIDTVRYRPAMERKNDECVRVGWIGTSSNFPYLFQIEQEIVKLRQRNVAFEFLICSDVDPVDFRSRTGASFVRWTPEMEVGFLQSLSIGIMPLADDDWCRGKCSFKIIQYMATGCPVVASNIGFNKDVVVQGENGLLVGAEWADALEFLLANPDAREKYAVRARASVIERFDIARISHSYAQVLSGLQ